MQFKITGKGVEISDAIKGHAEAKTSKLPRYNNSVTSVEVILNNEGGNPSVEVIARGEHNKVFVVTENSNGDGDMYSCMDLAIHKLERQISRAKEKERNPIHKSPNVES